MERVRMDRELQRKRILNIWRTGEGEDDIHLEGGAVDHGGELENWGRRETVELEKERAEVAFWRREDAEDKKSWRTGE
jgi:hypothetical protein